MNGYANDRGQLFRKMLFESCGKGLIFPGHLIKEFLPDGTGCPSIRLNQGCFQERGIRDLERPLVGTLSLPSPFVPPPPSHPKNDENNKL